VTPIFATPDSADRCCGQAVWTTSDASVVTVSDVEPDSILVESSVSVEAMGAGSAWVTATRGSLTDSVYVHVSAQGFNITVVEGGTENVADALSLVSDAARRWEEIVIGDLPSVPVSLEAGQCQQGIAAIDAVVDDLMLIVAPTTGSQSSVNPCVVREDGGLPAVAVIFVDAAALEATGFGEELALHLVGHALGFGLASPWDDALSATGSTDPRFTGAEATAEYQALGSADPDVPLQDTTQAGALDEMHWHETTFGAEIMTGAYVESVAHEIPLSRVTVGALTDLGYETAPWRADAFTLTLPPELVGAETLQIDERLWRPIWTVTDTGELAAQGAPAPAPPR